MGSFHAILYLNEKFQSRTLPCTDRKSKQRTVPPLLLSLQMSTLAFHPKLMTCEHHELKLSRFSLSSQELFLISGKQQWQRLQWWLGSAEFQLPSSFPRCSGLCDSIAATLSFPHYLATSMSNPEDLARHFCQAVYTPRPTAAAQPPSSSSSFIPA